MTEEIKNSDVVKPSQKKVQRKAALLATDLTVTYDVRMVSETSSRRLFGSKGTRTKVHAVKGVSLVAREGDFIGLVGRNGSGKSTLLRALAGVETPTSGTVKASAVPQLMGVGAALLPHLSGIDNVRIGLLAMGLEPEQIDDKVQQVIDLADLGSSIRMPMRTYSSGMGARLRFSIAVAAEPEILMIDEALSTGDDAFRERSNAAMKDLISRSGTGFLVNHSAPAIRELCTRVIWLDKGEIIQDGPTIDVMADYSKFMNALRRHGEDVALGLRERYRQSFQERMNYLVETSVRPDGSAEANDSDSDYGE